MASIRREVVIDSEPDVVWDALRDWGALHERLAAGFAVGLQREADARIVTFASGVTLREEILDVDNVHRRLAWSIVDGPYTHHNGAAQVFRRGGRPRAVRVDRRPTPRRLGRPDRRGDGSGPRSDQADARGHAPPAMIGSGVPTGV